MTKRENSGLGGLFEKLFPNQYIELAKAAMENLQVAFFMQSLQMGGSIGAGVRQRLHCDALQRMEHIVDGLDAVADAPVAYACAVMTCGCALVETMEEHLQDFCGEHIGLIGSDASQLAGFTARILYDAYKDTQPDIAARYRDGLDGVRVSRNKDINISDKLQEELVDLLGEDVENT